MLGVIGNTGRSYGTHLHFSALNRAERMSLNPLKMLPAFPDTAAPRLVGFSCVLGTGTRPYATGQRSADPALPSSDRNYRFLWEGRERLGIHSLAVHFNGRKVQEINFTAIEYSKIMIDNFRK
jgi:hypothetical protein